MTTKDTALRLALEALEYYEHRNIEWDYADERAIAAIREALAQPVGEPCVPCDNMGYIDGVGDICSHCEGTGALLSSDAQQGEQHSIPVSAYNRLQALCDSQAETIMKLQDKLDCQSKCKSTAWGADVMQRIVDSQTGFVREKP